MQLTERAVRWEQHSGRSSRRAPFEVFTHRNKQTTLSIGTAAAPIVRNRNSRWYYSACRAASARRAPRSRVARAVLSFPRHRRNRLVRRGNRLLDSSRYSADGAGRFADNVAAAMCESRSGGAGHHLHLSVRLVHRRSETGHPGKTLPSHVHRTAADLVPYVEQGMADALNSESANSALGLERLLVAPIPLWKRTMDIIGATFGLLISLPF